MLWSLKTVRGVVFLAFTGRLKRVSWAVLYPNRNPHFLMNIFNIHVFFQVVLSPAFSLVSKRLLMVVLFYLFDLLLLHLLPSLFLLCLCCLYEMICRRMSFPITDLGSFLSLSYRYWHVESKSRSRRIKTSTAWSCFWLLCYVPAASFASHLRKCTVWSWRISLPACGILTDT